MFEQRGRVKAEKEILGGIVIFRTYSPDTIAWVTFFSAFFFIDHKQTKYYYTVFKIIILNT